jgi:hypothetical protein
MRLPIDTGTMNFAAAAPAEPVLDYEIRAPKLDENRMTSTSTLFRWSSLT